MSGYGAHAHLAVSTTFAYRQRAVRIPTPGRAREPAPTSMNDLSAGPAQPRVDVARLFVALWPPAELAAALRRQCDALCGDAIAQPEGVDRLHMTLHFLGNVPRSRVAELETALSLPFDPFELSLQACERWGQGVLVMVPESAPPALMGLHGALAGRLAAFGLRVESRAFRPHVTLARRHGGPWSAVAQPMAPLHWPVHSYVLAESRATPRGAYQIVRTFEARADRAD